jgi:hypothetical protein
MRNSPFKLHSSPFAAAVCLKDWRAADTAMRDSANLKPAGTPQVTSEAKNNLVHDGRWNGYDTPPSGPASRGTNYASSRRRSPCLCFSVNLVSPN